jgi:hypothetical protein
MIQHVCDTSPLAVVVDIVGFPADLADAVEPRVTGDGMLGPFSVELEEANAVAGLLSWRPLVPGERPVNPRRLLLPASTFLAENGHGLDSTVRIGRRPR